VARLRILSTAQRVAVVVAAVFYIVAGSLHFIRPAPYLRIMPPYVPWHAETVGISGAFEILGGLGLLVPATRRAAGARVCASEKVCPPRRRREFKQICPAISGTGVKTRL
jgi:hypothetical protein